MDIRVGNIARGNKDGEYIGRAFRGRQASPLGNKFSVKRYGREKCIEMFRQWLFGKIKDKDPAVMTELHRLLALAKREKSLTLLCWCAPKPCHGDTLKKALVWLDSQDPVLNEAIELGAVIKFL